MTDTRVEMKDKVGFDDFSKKSNFLHEKINKRTGNLRERVAVIESRQGVRRVPDIESDDDKESGE